MSPKKEYMGKTKAYARFKQHYWRTDRLLDAGISGLEESRKPLEGLLERFVDVKAPRGRPPKDYEPSIESTKSNDGGGITLSIDDRSAVLLKKVLAKQLGEHKDLNYHYFSILAVSIWGSYETYVYMLFEELFEKQSRMLKTDESISYGDAFEHKNNIVQYLSEKSLEKIGHFNLKEFFTVADKLKYFQLVNLPVKAINGATEVYIDFYLEKNVYLEKNHQII